MTWDWSSIHSLQKGVIATVMTILQETGAKSLHWWTLALPSHKVDGSSFILSAPSFGHLSYSHGEPCHWPRQNILPFQWHSMMTYPSWNCWVKWRTTAFISSAHNPLSSARFFKTTMVPLSLLTFQSYCLGPSTSMCVTITSKSTNGLDWSKSLPSALRIKLWTCSPSHSPRIFLQAL